MQLATSQRKQISGQLNINRNQVRSKRLGTFVVGMLSYYTILNRYKRKLRLNLSVQ
jgi:hypothetical protein